MDCARPNPRGLTLVEVVLSMGLLAMALLALATVCMSGMRMNRKSLGESAAGAVAEAELARSVNRMLEDQPRGSRELFWKADHPYPGPPWSSGNSTIGNTVYSFNVYSETVTSTGGASLGSLATNNTLKRVDIEVSWWGGQRGQYGQLKAHDFRLVNQGETP